MSLSIKEKETSKFLADDSTKHPPTQSKKRRNRVESCVVKAKKLSKEPKQQLTSKIEEEGSEREYTGQANQKNSFRPQASIEKKITLFHSIIIERSSKSEMDSSVINFPSGNKSSLESFRKSANQGSFQTSVHNRQKSSTFSPLKLKSQNKKEELKPEINQNCLDSESNGNIIVKDEKGL